MASAPTGMTQHSGGTAGRSLVRRRAVPATLLAAAALALLYVFAIDARLHAAPPAATVAAAQDFSKFQHTNPQHARLPCLLCHKRETQGTRPSLPGHMPCAGCHAEQFADAGNPVCRICHTNPPAANLKAFPRLRTFNVRFDHATHSRGAARGRAGCATCHKPQRGGAALSIPVGFSAHATCYQCHATRAQSEGRDISSCGTCHQIGSYSRTPVTRPAFRMSFSHAAHTAQKIACSECHSVRAGAGQGRQVTSPSPAQHHAPSRGMSCITCHNDKRAFGGDDFSDCVRCHKGETWRF